MDKKKPTKGPQEKPTDKVTKDSPIEDKVNALYQEGVAPVNIARLLRLEVDEVLVMTGNGDLTSIQFVGDRVDQQEIGNQATVNPYGERYDIKYTKN